MPFPSLFRREAPQPDAGVGVVIITGSCCIPGMRPFDEQARRVVQEAVTQTGVPAQVKELPVSNALFGGVPKQVLADLMAMNNEGGRIGLPAVLVNGTVVSYGVPTLETVTAALREGVSHTTQAIELTAESAACDMKGASIRD